MIENNNDSGIVEGLGIWEHFTVRDGLPDMKIECIFEDRDGVLWIGTHDRGVVRYDGGKFQSYTRRDGLVGDNVFSIIEDKQGDLWFGTKQGLSRFNGNKFETIDTGESFSFLWGSCMDHVGNLWFGVEWRPGQPAAVCRWDGNSLELININNSTFPQGESIHQVINGPNGTLWLGGDRLYHYDGIEFSDFSRIANPLDQIQCLNSDEMGTLWIAAESGLFTYDGTELFKLLEADPSGHGLVSILRDDKGILWLTTFDGKLLAYDGSAIQVVRDFGTTLGRLFLDSVGRLWIGTYGMGLFYYDSVRFKIFQTEQGLPSNSICCLAEDANSTLWIGTKEGLLGYNGNRIIDINDLIEVENKEITSLLIDSRGRLWIGIGDGLLYYYDGNQLNLVTGSSSQDIIFNLIEDERGRIWFGAKFGGGFGYCKENKIKQYKGDEERIYPTWIGAIEVDQQGIIWLGSTSPAIWDGLCQFDGKSFQRISEISGSPISALCADKDGGMWVGTSEGLIHYTNTKIDYMTIDEGLSCEIITSIFQTGDGVLWIGTEGGGVCCYDGKIIQVIEIPGDPARNVIHAIYSDGHGSLWFATEGGLIRYDPRQIQPEIAIKEIVADDVYTGLKEVQFPTTVGRIGFQFGAKSIIEHVSYLVYRYRLEGYDLEWKQTKEAQVEYSQLEPGEYQFLVQAIDRDLNYSNTASAKLNVTEDLKIEALNDALRNGTTRGDFIGESSALRVSKRQISEVAETNLTVLVLGETGTGKGLAARAIHDLSVRYNKPLIHVNCGAIPKDLVDSELFGHERGAFTGAISRSLGKFELADGGTIFLDEIGDLPLEAQVRLLRVLDHRSMERIGGTQTLALDVRVIAATNRDLTQAMREGNFRPDLYYRLNVFPITIPPLRNRKDDIPLLTEYFVRQFTMHLHKEMHHVTQDAIRELCSYEWPGNVRELEHILQRAVLYAKDGTIQANHIVLGVPEPSADNDYAILPLEEYERRYLVRVLEHTGGTIGGKNGAAVLLKMHPNTLHSRLKKLGLKKKITIEED